MGKAKALVEEDLRRYYMALLAWILMKYYPLSLALKSGRSEGPTSHTVVKLGDHNVPTSCFDIFHSSLILT